MALKSATEHFFMINPSRRPMFQQYVICPVQVRHHEDIARLAGQLGYESSVEQVHRRLDGMRDAQQYAVYVAEERAGNVVGWIGVHIFRAVEMDSCASISGLVVDQCLRSQGIGEMLLDAADQWAQSFGCEVITVQSNVMRERAHSFYRRNGYAHVKTQHTFCKNLSQRNEGKGRLQATLGL
jgi:GNAT superfamily N-acetyltransferase